jgi:hypothetical protein
MSLGFEHPSSDPRPRMGLARAAVRVGIATTIATVAPSHSVVGGATPCVRTSANVARYCGSASARLSVFPDALFRGGFCARTMIAGSALLQVRIGAKALDGSWANDGLSYFSLGFADSRSQQRSGNVIAFFRSKRWLGRVVSSKRKRDGGTFVAQGVAGSRGRASGRFRC